MAWTTRVTLQAEPRRAGEDGDRGRASARPPSPRVQPSDRRSRPRRSSSGDVDRQRSCQMDAVALAAWYAVVSVENHGRRSLAFVAGIQPAALRPQSRRAREAPVASRAATLRWANV